MKAIAPTFEHHDVLGRPVAERILAEVAEQALILATKGLPPHLVSVTIGDTAAVDDRGAGHCFQPRQQGRQNFLTDGGHEAGSLSPTGFQNSFKGVFQQDPIG